MLYIPKVGRKDTHSEDVLCVVFWCKEEKSERVCVCKMEIC